ncbi:sensor histidine kinase [Jidongwangia harbinensis]|uniref:sensor histidine kinase n=1 Tax=Jidongwangia harbinensis TaxID=2878561 RepID=UPI001CD9C862|nr:histidine kinase [Jidongwangia harbinensis]MCA2217495.1 histidine kinase [Jidongwangia harbinensis]
MGAEALASGLVDAGRHRAAAYPRRVADRLRRLADAHRTATRLAGAGVLLLLTVLITATPGRSAFTATAIVTAVVVTASFVVIPALRWPAWLIPAIATTGVIAAMPSAATDSPARTALIVTMFLYSLRSEKVAVVVATAAVSVASVLAGSVLATGYDRIEFNDVEVLPWIVASAALGRAVRANRARRTMLVERALRAEVGRENEARQRVQAERLRIARELHDAVGHQVALINVQAGAMTLLLDRHDLVRARQSLDHIQNASEAALVELKLTVGLLRQPGEHEPVQPAGRLSRLDELITSFAATGLRVSCDVTGPARPLPDAVDLTAYRLIQESLTNTAKHAAGTSASIRLEFRPDALALTVEDDGPPVRAVAQTVTSRTGGPMGHGIIGMRERAAALGGRLSAGPRPEGGFRVTAELPTLAGATA